MTAAEAEKYVRERWDGVSIQWGRIEGKRYAMASNSEGRAIPLHGYETEAEAWLAAAEFTKQREEEIRLKGEEITHVNGWITMQAHSQQDMTVYRRILSVLESQMADLRRGWKG